MLVLLLLVPGGSACDNRTGVVDRPGPFPDAGSKGEVTTERNLDPVIPGIYGAVLVARLEEQGLTCSPGGRELYPVYYDCLQSTPTEKYRVHLYCDDANHVQVIKAYASSDTPETTAHRAGAFLAFAASMPFEGKKAATAEKWVLDHIMTDTAQVIEGMLFTLGGDERARNLRIAPAQ
ncbi:MAG: hypothetical protein ACE5G0_06520 [Rhodothermales bacterium]